MNLSLLLLHSPVGSEGPRQREYPTVGQVPQKPVPADMPYSHQAHRGLKTQLAHSSS